MMSHLQEALAVSRQPEGSSYNLLKNHLINKQLQQQQEKQRHMEQINGGHIQFQGPGRSLTTDCGGYSMGAPQQPNSSILSHSGPLLSNRMDLSTSSVTPMGPSAGGYLCNKGSKQPPSHPLQDFRMAMQPGQGLMGIGGSPRQPLHPSHGVIRPGMPCPSVAGGPVPTHHLRQAFLQGTLPSRMMFTSQQQPSSQSQLLQHQQGVQAHMNPGNHRHSFPSGGAPHGCGGPQFSQQSSMAGMPITFPRVRPPPNQVAPGLVARQDQPLTSITQQSLRIRGPLSALAVMKPDASSVMHSAHAMAPPSYQIASAGKHCSSQGYGPGHNSGQKLPSFDYSAQHQSNGAMSSGLQGPGRGAAGGEVDFIDTLVGGNEDWLNNLTMIDEYLEQNS